MKLKELSLVAVKRTISHTWEEWDEATGENAQKSFDLEIWFKRNKLNQATFNRIKAATDEKQETEFRTILLESIEKWNLEDPVGAEAFDQMPFELLVQIIESFSGLITVNPPKSKN